MSTENDFSLNWNIILSFTSDYMLYFGVTNDSEYKLITLKERPAETVKQCF